MIAGPGKWAGPVGPPHAAVITRLLQHAVPSTEKEHSPRRISEYSPQGTACCSSLVMTAACGGPTGPAHFPGPAIMTHCHPK